jgi:hypothetical protein
MSQGKNKGLLNYNNQHGMSSLKNTSNEHLELYRRWGLFLLQRMRKTNKNQVAKRRRIVPPFQIIITNLISNLTTIMSKHGSTMNPIQLYIIICLNHDAIFWCSASTT